MPSQKTYIFPLLLAALSPLASAAPPSATLPAASLPYPTFPESLFYLNRSLADPSNFNDRFICYVHVAEIKPSDADPKISFVRLIVEQDFSDAPAPKEFTVPSTTFRHFTISSLDPKLPTLNEKFLFWSPPKTLAQILINEKLMPDALGGDGLHVAIASLQKMDHILSWNVQHLANPNKREHLGIVLARLDIMAPEITTPDLLWNR